MKRHLDPGAILEDNARILSGAASNPETFLGPQMTEHRKPNRVGQPCDVCGCNGIRVGVLHKALPALHGGHGNYAIFAQDYTGEWAERRVNWDGK